MNKMQFIIQFPLFVCNLFASDSAEQPLGEAKSRISIRLVLDLAGSEGLPGPHADSGPPRTSQCH